MGTKIAKNMIKMFQNRNNPFERKNFDAKYCAAKPYPQLVFDLMAHKRIWHHHYWLSCLQIWVDFGREANWGEGFIGSANILVIGRWLKNLVK